MQFDPVAVNIFGFKVHWYGILWAAGFVLFYFVGNRFGGQILAKDKVNVIVDDLLLFCGCGALIGGRLGYVIFYGSKTYLQSPLKIFQIWEGGMSFHGGLIGVIIAAYLISRRHKLDLLRVLDLTALCTPLGLACGRLGNFINGELWGRVTDVPWALVFPAADNLARHPSQLYELVGEGILLFVILLYLNKCRPVPGIIGFAFLILYGVIRFIIEFFREPDGHLGLRWLDLSTGQWLSLPVIGAGIAAVIYLTMRDQPIATKRKVKANRQRK